MSPGLASAAPAADRTSMAAIAPPLGDLRSHRVALDDGAAVTVHVACYPRARVRAAVVALPSPEPLGAWCARAGVADALVGGFFVTPAGPALGEVWVEGRRAATAPVDPRFAAARACLHLDGDRASVAPLSALDGAPRGDLIQAGPALVAGGRPLVRDGEDPEGFRAGVAQFDSDITAGRHPRAALGLDATRLVAVVSEGRATGEAGLTLAELAALMARLGVHDAINLDGGGSASLVVGGRLVNRPREADGRDLPGGRPIATALAFAPGPGAQARPEAAAA